LKPGGGRHWEVEATESHDLRCGNGADDDALRVMASMLKWWDAAEIPGNTRPQPAAMAEAL